jgi:hypothetical protein
MRCRRYARSFDWTGFDLMGVSHGLFAGGELSDREEVFTDTLQSTQPAAISRRSWLSTGAVSTATPRQ